MPNFVRGMKFSGKQEFKRAIIDYGLHEKKEIKFVEDEGDRVRAQCSWPMCPWFCLLKKTCRFASWQVTSFNNAHTCPQRRDIKLVTATRIVNRFQNLIVGNPEWSMHHLQQTVQEEMFTNMHISKIKRAKAVVVTRMMDARLGEYGKVLITNSSYLEATLGAE